MKKILFSVVVLSSIFLTGCTGLNIFEKGNKAFENKDYETAIKNYKMALFFDSQNAEIYSQYCGAKSYFYDKDNKKVDLNKALLLCDKSIELNSNIDKTHFYKGRVYGQLNKHKEAVEEYSKAIEINQNYARAYFNRGIEKEKFGLINEAIEDYTKVINMKDNDVLLLAYYNRAFTYTKIKENDKAKKDYETIINMEIKNNTSEEYMIRGAAKGLLKDYPGAIFDLSRAINLDSNNEWTYEMLAESKMLNKDYTGAIKTANEGLEKFKNNETLFLTRGKSYIGQKIIECAKNGNYNCSIDSKYWNDLLQARELALKNNNENIYKESVDFEKRIQEHIGKFNMKLQTIETTENNQSMKENKQPIKKSKLKQLYDKNGRFPNYADIVQDFTDNYLGGMLNGEIEKYNMAAKQNDKMNACVSAGQVSQIYLELKDNANYNKWKSLEKRACSWMNY